MRDRSLENGLILGFVTNCLVRPSVPDCPLHHLQGMALDEQIVQIEQLADAEMDELLRLHQQCIAVNWREYL